MSFTPPHRVQPVQHRDPGLSHHYSFIEQWRETVTTACYQQQQQQQQQHHFPSADSDTDPARGVAADRHHKCKRLHATHDSHGPAAGADMSTPPPSDRTRSASPSKRMKLSHRSLAPGLGDQDDEDDPFLSHSLVSDPDLTPRRNPAAGIIGTAPQLPRPSLQSTAGYPTSVPGARRTPSIASRTTTSTTTKSSRARSTSPTKRTQSLTALRKPIYHVPLDDQDRTQLPADVRDLYNRLYDITVEHEGIAPWEARDEINAGAARPWRDFSFKRRRRRRREKPPACSSGEGNAAVATEEEEHDDPDDAVAVALALAELRAIRELERYAWDCRTVGRSEASWNTEVHYPLLKLALDRPEFPYVRQEIITWAQIAKPFVPPMGDLAPDEYADRKMVDLAMVLVPEPVRRPLGKEEETEEAHEAALQSPHDAEQQQRQRIARLARAIQRVVRSQPADRRCINQTTHAPLSDRPIGVSIEAKADGASEEGRVQLAVWTAAWHERVRHLLVASSAAGGSRSRWSSGDARLITLPLLLIVGHSWVLSFACDRGDRLEVVGDMTLGETSTLKGLYTLVAAVRELASWMQGPFADWLLDMLEDC